MKEKKNPRQNRTTRANQPNLLYSKTDIEALKARTAEYLRRVHGITNPYTAFSSPWREDKHPSCSLDRNTNHVKDFGRPSIYYDVFDMAKLDFGATKFSDQIDEVAHVLGVSVSKEPIPYGQKPKVKQRTTHSKPAPIAGENILDAVQKAGFNLHEQQGTHALEYLHRRGFTDANIRAYGLGWVDHPKTLSVRYKAFPYGDAGYVVLPFPSSDDFKAVHYCVFRPLFEGVGKELKLKGTAPIYREYRLCEPGEIYVTEGIYDAISFEILHGVRACALCGCGGDTRLLNVLANIPRPERPRLILSLDDDEAGRNYRDNLTTRLEAIGAAFEISKPYPKGCKDANDALIAQRKGVS